MSSKHDTNARRPGKEARHHIAVMRNLLMSEIDDFCGRPGATGRTSNTRPDTQGITPPRGKRRGLRHKPERLTGTWRASDDTRRALIGTNRS